MEDGLILKAIRKDYSKKMMVQISNDLMVLVNLGVISHDYMKDITTILEEGFVDKFYNVV